MTRLLLPILVLLSMNATAQTTTAKALSDSCQKILSAVGSKGATKGKWDGKRSEDIYESGQCEGYIEGWMDGIDGAILTNDKGAVLLQIKRSQITSTWTIANVLVRHLRDVPLDEGKPADTVLRTILIENELITLTPYYKQNPTAGDSSLQSTSEPQ